MNWFTGIVLIIYGVETHLIYNSPQAMSWIIFGLMYIGMDQTAKSDDGLQMIRCLIGTIALTLSTSLLV